MTYKLDPWQRIVYLHQYHISPDYTLRNEGTNVIFTITTTGIANGTIVYWKLEGVTGSITNGDFSNPTNPVTAGGSVTINNNTANFTVTIANDVTTEGTESFCAKLYTGSVNGILRATSATVTITDTSINNEITVPQINLNIIDIDFNSTGSKLAVLHDSSDAVNYYATIYNVSGTNVTIGQRIGPSHIFADHWKGHGSIDWSPDDSKLVIATGRGLGSAIYSDPFSTQGSEYSEIEVWQGTTKIFSVGSTGFFPNRNLYPDTTTYPDGPSGNNPGGGARWVSDTRFIVDGNGGLVAFDYSNSTPSPTNYFPVINYRYYISGRVDFPYLNLEGSSARILNTGNTFFYLLGNTITGITYPSGSATQTGIPNSTNGNTYAISNFDISASGYKVAGFDSWPDENSTRNLFLYSGYTIAGGGVSEDTATPSNDSFTASAVAISADGTKVAVAGGLVSRGHVVQLYTRSGTTLTYSASFGPTFSDNFNVKFMKFNTQGSVLAVVSSDGGLKLFTV